MKKSLRELLKKEESLLEDLEGLDFEYSEYDIYSSGEEIVAVEDKLKKVRSKIIIALENELSNRKAGL